MRKIGPYFVAAIIFIVFAMSCGASSDGYSLRVSKLSDRAFATELHGHSVSGNIYAFVSPETGISRVQFFIDNPSGRGTPVSTENRAPFDLLGGAIEAATPFDTRRLSEGRHSLTAVITLTSGRTVTVTAQFTVKNRAFTNNAIYWGVSMDGVPWNMNKLREWEAMVGKPASIVHFWQTWTERGALQPFKPTLMQNVRRHGSIPMITWLPENPTGGVNQPDFQLVDIITGKYDDYLEDWAADARNWGHPFFLRWAHEMNGFWFPWGEDANGNRRGEYVKAWRHIVDIFRAAGAQNVTWVWCPNIDWSGSGWPTMQSLYPGDDYVDWTCVDGFNWGENNGGWRSFNDIFRWSYEYIHSFAPDKPMMIAEFGSSEKGGQKAAWITEALGSHIPFEFPGIKAVVWYNHVMNQDWRIETSRASVAAFRVSIASPYYSANEYGDIKTSSPIPPLK